MFRKPTSTWRKISQHPNLTEKRGGNRIRLGETWSGDLWRHQSPWTEDERGRRTEDKNAELPPTLPTPPSITDLKGGDRETRFTLSIMSGRLVAASTVTSRSCSTPSISVSSWARTRSPTPLEPEDLQRQPGRKGKTDERRVNGRALGKVKGMTKTDGRKGWIWCGQEKEGAGWWAGKFK